MSSTVSGAVVDAMQDALAGEHAAIYAYGVVGGRLDYGTDDQQLATEQYTAHRSRRDQLAGFVSEAGAEPVGTEPAYELPIDVDETDAPQRIGQQVEDRCSVLYAGVVAVATGEIRSAAITALGEAAVAGIKWDAPSAALPGVERP